MLPTIYSDRAPKLVLQRSRQRVRCLARHLYGRANAAAYVRDARWSCHRADLRRIRPFGERPLHGHAPHGTVGPRSWYRQTIAPVQLPWRLQRRKCANRAHCIHGVFVRAGNRRQRDVELRLHVAAPGRGSLSFSFQQRPTYQFLSRITDPRRLTAAWDAEAGDRRRLMPARNPFKSQ